MSIARWVLAVGLVAVAAPASAEMSSSQTKSGMLPERSSAQKPSAATASSGATQLDFGYFSSMTLTSKAWEALKAGDYAAV